LTLPQRGRFTSTARARIHPHPQEAINRSAGPATGRSARTPAAS